VVEYSDLKSENNTAYPNHCPNLDGENLISELIFYRAQHPGEASSVKDFPFAGVRSNLSRPFSEHTGEPWMEP